MENKQISFIWSTGRTGTLSLTQLLNISENIKAIHEPKPSRRFYILSRLYLDRIGIFIFFMRVSRYYGFSSLNPANNRKISYNI